MRPAAHAWPRLIWVALASLATCGCAGLWDEITSRNRDLKGYFWKPEPMVVLKTSNDGSKRARALASLQEPLKHGGTEEQEQEYFNILTREAEASNDPLCRLGAIRALGHCQNPRSVKILEEVIQQRLPFTTEFNSLIRQQALTSLEEIGAPEARHWLIRVARQPNATGSFQDRQQTLDERLTAIRGLGKFKQYDATETLLYILETEKDVALRDRAHQSLQLVTHKKLPADAVVWREFLHDPNTNLAAEPSLIQRVSSWVEWVDPFHK